MFFLIFLLGLAVGSFINMAVYRYSQRWRIKDILAGAKFSSCDFCGRRLSWRENIPVASCWAQGRKSRCCRKKLPVTYPVVELATGALFLIYSLRFITYGSNIVFFLLGLAMIALLVFSAVVDAKYLILPDEVTAMLIIIAVLGVVFDEKNIVPYLGSALGAAGFLGVIYLLSGGRGMGLGDVKLAVFMGLFLGWPQILLAVYTAFVAGAIVGLGLMMAGKAGRKTQIPFGPFLILGTIAAWFWGNGIWYYVLNSIYWR